MACAGLMQLLTARYCKRPSTASATTTVQAPQSPAAQPSLVAVRRRSSRSRSKQGAVWWYIAQIHSLTPVPEAQGLLGQHRFHRRDRRCWHGGKSTDLNHPRPKPDAGSWADHHNAYRKTDMKSAPHLFDKIDLQLIRTLHTLLIERSVSKTAMRLGQQQPAVSVALKRLRELTGDPILVRSGNGMVPTDVGLADVGPRRPTCCSRPKPLFAPAAPLRSQPKPKRPSASPPATRLDPLFLPACGGAHPVFGPPMPRSKFTRCRPQGPIRALTWGKALVDVVIGNWARAQRRSCTERSTV